MHNKDLMRNRTSGSTFAVTHALGQISFLSLCILAPLAAFWLSVIDLEALVSYTRHHLESNNFLSCILKIFSFDSDLVDFIQEIMNRVCIFLLQIVLK